MSLPALWMLCRSLPRTFCTCLLTVVPRTGLTALHLEGFRVVGHCAWRFCTELGPVFLGHKGCWPVCGAGRDAGRGASLLGARGAPLWRIEACCRCRCAWVCSVLGGCCFWLLHTSARVALCSYMGLLSALAAVRRAPCTPLLSSLALMSFISSWPTDGERSSACASVHLAVNGSTGVPHRQGHKESRKCVSIYRLIAMYNGSDSDRKKRKYRSRKLRREWASALQAAGAEGQHRATPTRAAAPAPPERHCAPNIPWQQFLLMPHH